MIPALFVYVNVCSTFFLYHEDKRFHTRLKQQQLLVKRSLGGSSCIYTEIVFKKETATQMNVLLSFAFFLSFKRHFEQTHKITITLFS